LASHPSDPTLLLNGESYAFRRLVDVGSTTFYALGSIDESSRAATQTAFRELVIIAGGATALALAASFWVARMLTEPVGRLSESLAQMSLSHDVTRRLPLSGSSRELDALTTTFNELMASVAAAEE